MKTLLQKNFNYWVDSIVDDYPIPPEIMYIYFCFVRKNNFIYVCMGGCEFEQDLICNFEYYPLEAQFFNPTAYDNNFNINILKKLLDSLFESKYFKDLFFGKQVFLAVWGKKQSFLIENT